MEQLMSTGLQMMQVDVAQEGESLCVIRALNTITFDDLHKIICHKLSVPNDITYTFYLPKTKIIVRKVTRSFDHSSLEPLAAYIQSGDMIHYRIYESEFHVRFSSMGVVAEASAAKAKLLVTQTKIKNMMKKENITYRNHLSAETAQNVYELCEQLYDSGIFYLLCDQLFLMLHIGDMLQPVFVENKDEQFLLYFFCDEESYRSFYCVYKDTLPQQNIYKYKQATILRFANAPLTSLAYDYYGDSYISLLDMQRGWEIDGINEETAAELQIILPVLLRAIVRMRMESFTLANNQDILHVVDQSERNTCKLLLEKPEAMVLPILPYEKPHNIETLLKQELLTTYLEMDYRFIRQPHKGAPDERQAYLLNVSALGPHIQSHYEHLFASQQDIKNAFLDMMVNIIEEHGRPQQILVKDRYVYSILEDMCKQLKIFLKIEPRLLNTEAYFADNTQIIYDIGTDEKPFEQIKKAVDEQPLQHQYNRKRFKIKGYFNE